MQTHPFPQLAFHFLLPLLLALTPTLYAQTNTAPIQGATKILDALTSKAVILDQPGTRRGHHGPAIDLQVQFMFDSAQLLPQGKRQLDQLAMALNDQQLQVSGFQLAGHTDQVGNADYNIKLSLARAEAVKAYLTQIHGISSIRLQTIGFGFTHLLNPDQPHAALNRRVEVRRLAMQATIKSPNP